MTIAAWSALLVTAGVVGDGAALGASLTAGFIVQVAPPLWTAYRVAHPSGVSAGTWLLIFAELAYWLIFGVEESDPRIVTLGAAGVVASSLMLARIRYSVSGRQTGPSPAARQDQNPLPVSAEMARDCLRQPVESNIYSIKALAG